MDIVILVKNADGTVEGKEVSDFENLGDLAKIEEQLAETLAADDVVTLAEVMEPGSVAGGDHLREPVGRAFGSAARRAGGRLIANGRIPIQAIIAAVEADEAAAAEESPKPKQWEPDDATPYESCCKSRGRDRRRDARPLTRAKAAVVGAAVGPGRRRSPRPPSSAPLPAPGPPRSPRRRGRRRGHPGAPPLVTVGAPAASEASPRGSVAPRRRVTRGLGHGDDGSRDHGFGVQPRGHRVPRGPRRRSNDRRGSRRARRSTSGCSSSRSRPCARRSTRSSVRGTSPSRPTRRSRRCGSTGTSVSRRTSRPTRRTSRRASAGAAPARWGVTETGPGAYFHFQPGEHVRRRGMWHPPTPVLRHGGRFVVGHGADGPSGRSTTRRSSRHSAASAATHSSACRRRHRPIIPTRHC